MTSSIDQHALNYHRMRMPMRPHHAPQMHAQLLQQKHHQQRTPCHTERGGFAGPLALDRTKPSTSHDLSNDDDGETSSASEDSAASYPAEATANYKRPAEPSATVRLPPSQRARTTPSPLQQPPGWLPVSSGGTFETGTAAAGQQRQLPRLAALETLLSSHNQQQPEQNHQPLRRSSSPPSFLQQQPQHHQRQDFALGPHAPTTRLGLVSRTNATVQLPSLLQAAKSTASQQGSLSSSASSSPTCSPVLRSSSPSYGYRHELPLPACTQGTAGTSGRAAGSVNVNQRWLLGTGSTNAESRRQVPRIDALSPTSDGAGRPQPWHTAAVALEAAAAAGAATAAAAAAAGKTAVTCWPTKHAGEPRRGFPAQTTVPYSHASGASTGYARELDEERSNAAWARQKHSTSAAWPMQRHHLQQQQAILTQHPSETAAPPSRTPSPLSSRHGQELHVSARQQGLQQQQQQQETLLSRPPSSTFGSSSASTSSSSSSPEKRSWSPPLVDGGRPASSAAVAGEAAAQRGKWDEEAQARASGSLGKQILQRYLTHLYPKASREVWSHDEEEVLWRAQKEYGNAWSYISSLLPGRSENAVKNHWYTQMRMFIGQRGNNASSSKPCPPPSARAGSSKSAGGKGSNRQNKRKPEDDRIDASKHQQQQQPQQHRTNPPGAPAGGEHGTETAASSRLNMSRTERRVTATVAEDEEEVFDIHEEKQARADAVAALGMLFSQGNTSGAASSAEDRR